MFSNLINTFSCHQSQERIEAIELLKAIKSKRLSRVNLKLNQGIDVNSILYTRGPKTGYTALHLACLYGYSNLAELLVKNFNANVNVVAADGSQPIHLATLYFKEKIMKLLLNKGADVNSNFEQKLILKHAKYAKWSDDFGGKMSLLSYCVFNENFWAVSILVKYRVDIRTKSIFNKTILMYAIEKDELCSASYISSAMKDQQEAANSIDIESMHVLHYLLYDKRYNEYRYDQDNLNDGIVETKSVILKRLIREGADICATINGNPETLMLNLAAYRCCYKMFKILLPLYTSVERSRTLMYVNRPIEPHQRYLQVHNRYYRPPGPWAVIRKEKKKCIKLILKDWILRSTFGMLVLEEEEMLIKEIIKKGDRKSFVENWKSGFVNGFMENRTFKFDRKRISYYDLAILVFNNRTLRSLAKDDNKLFSLVNHLFVAEINEFVDEDLEYLMALFKSMIARARRRSELLKELEKVQELTKCIPLPYEIILCIVDCLNNVDLEKFIGTFYINFNYSFIDFSSLERFLSHYS